MMRTRKVTRLIPPHSNPTVKVGDPVAPSTVIARSSRLSRQLVLPVGEELGHKGPIEPLMLKSVGETCQYDEPYARGGGMLTGGKHLKSPADAKLAAVYSLLGVAVLEMTNRALEVTSMVRGNVIEVVYDRCISIEVEGEFLWGAVGWGVDTRGTLASYDDLRGQARPEILYYAGKTMTGSLIKEARSRGVQTLIGSTMSPVDWRAFLLHQTSGAITNGTSGWASASIGLTGDMNLVLLQGFGEDPLQPDLLELLRAYEHGLAALLLHPIAGRMAFKPQLVVQQENASTMGGTEDPLERELAPGRYALVLRPPVRGAVVRTDALPDPPFRLPTGARVPVARVSSPGAASLIVPRVNLEPLTD